MNTPTERLTKPTAITFSPFHIDLRGGRLCRAGETIPLRPKTWGVLVHLASRRGALITKDELLDAVWRGIAVTPDTLTKSIGELRLALGDDAKSPRFIETVHRRGFRFIADTEVSGSKSLVSGVREDRPETRDQEPGTNFFVGREAELRRLEDLLAKAHAGERQMVFVSGPAGIGKSALIEAFLDSTAVQDAPMVWVGRGSCIDQHGLREAYLPVLEALERLARRADASRLTDLLRSTAPAWLAQMPWLIGDDEEAVQRSMRAARPERMLRELGATIETLTRDLTLVLVLEDLHWSDPSTVDLLAFLAQRRETARLLVIATYRPADAVVHEHALLQAVRTLEVHRQCVELPVHELGVEDVQRYLDRRFPGSQFPPPLAALIHGHTDGHPLFVVAVIEHMVARGWILETGPGWSLSVSLEKLDLEVPEDMRRVIDTAIEALSPADRDLLEAASVSGIEFAPQALAALLGCTVGDAEMRCETLARTSRFLRVAGRAEWPDGSVARCYAFIHEVYRRTVYAEIPDGRRVQLHQRLGEAIEAVYGSRAPEIASVLTDHFLKSRDHGRAVRYLAATAQRARQRFANHEAVGHLEAALGLIAHLPEAHERNRRELELRMMLGPILNDLHGYAAEPVRENYERADVLCAEVASPAEHFEIVYALCHFLAVRGNEAVHTMTGRLEHLAGLVATADARVRTNSALVRIDVVAGRFAEASARMQNGLGSYVARGIDTSSDFGPDPIIDANIHYALALWFLGYPSAALEAAREGLAAARDRGSLFTVAAALSHSGILELFRGNSNNALALGEEAYVFASEHGFPYWRAMGSAVKGAALVLRGQNREGRDELQRARVALQATGSRVFSTHILGFLADAHLRAGAVEEGLAAVDEGLALAESTIDRTYRPELWRLKGELLLAASASTSRRSVPHRRAAVAPADPDSNAVRCLQRAVETARVAKAKSLELRAAMSLARAGGRNPETRKRLARVCQWFGDDVRTSDLIAARSLLDELATPSSARARPRSAGQRRRQISANLPRTFRT